MVAVSKNLFLLAALFTTLSLAAPGDEVADFVQNAEFDKRAPTSAGPMNAYESVAYANAHRADGSVDTAAYEQAGDFVSGLNDATNLLLASRGSSAAGQVYYRLNQLDHVIDGTAGFIGSVLSPLTFGLSKDLTNFLTGPIVQSVTHGILTTAAVVAGSPVDLVTGQAQNMVQTAKKFNSALSRSHVDTTKLVSATNQLQQHINEAKNKGKRSVANVDEVISKLDSVNKVAGQTSHQAASQELVCPFVEQITPDVVDISNQNVDSNKGKDLANKAHQLLSTVEKAHAHCDSAVTLANAAAKLSSN